MRWLAGCAVLVLLLLYVWERVDVVQTGYRIERLKVQKVALERERDELRVTLSGLASPERIARVASDRLGLMRPEQGQVKVVKLDAPAIPVRSSSSGLQLAKHLP